MTSEGLRPRYPLIRSAHECVETHEAVSKVVPDHRVNSASELQDFGPATPANKTVDCALCVGSSTRSQAGVIRLGASPGFVVGVLLKFSER